MDVQGIYNLLLPFYLCERVGLGKNLVKRFAVLNHKEVDKYGSNE
jgi:hypothetical protein